MTSKLEQLRQDESTSQQKQSNFDLLYTLYKESSQEQSLQQFIDDYTQGEKVPSDVRALYVTGDRKSYKEVEDAFKVTDYLPDKSTWEDLKKEGYNPITLFPKGSRRVAANISESIIGGTFDLGTSVAELVASAPGDDISGGLIIKGVPSTYQQAEAKKKIDRGFTEFRKYTDQVTGTTVANVFGRDIMKPRKEWQDYDIPEVQEPVSGTGQTVSDIGAFAASWWGGKKLIDKAANLRRKPKDPYKELQGGKGRKSKKVLAAEAALLKRATIGSYARSFGGAEIGAQVAFDPKEIRIAYDIGEWAGNDTFLLSDIFNFLDLEDPEELSEVENRLGLLTESLALTGIISTAFKIPKGLSGTYQGGKGLINFLKSVKAGGPKTIEAFKKAVNEGSRSNQALQTRAARELEMPYLRGDLAEKAKAKGLGFLAPMADIVERTAQKLTTRGFFTHQMFDIWKNADNAKIAWERKAIDYSAKIESNIKKLAKEQNLSFKEADQIFTQYLNGTIKLKDIKNVEARKLVKEIRQDIDNFSNLVISQLKRKTGNKTIDAANKKKIKEIRANMGKYLRKTYEMYENKKYKPSDEIREKLTILIASRLKGYTNTEKGKKARYAEATKRIDELLKSQKSEKAVVGHLNSVYGQQQLRKVFAHRKNIDPVLREFLGETTEASYTVFRTLTTLANTTANVRMFDDLLAVGKNKYFFKEGSRAYKNVTDSRLKSSRIEGEMFHALDGYHTTDDIAELFLRQKKRLIDNEYMSWYKTFLQVKGFGQASATVLNHITHLRNTAGGALMMMGNGLNPFDQEIRKSFKIVSNQFTDAVSKEKGLNDLYLKYQKLGIVNQNVRVGEFKSLMNEGDILTRVDNSLRNKGLLGPAKKGVKDIYKKTEQAYVAEDDIFRIASYHKELEVLKRANKLNPTSNRLSSTQLENKAAEIVKDTLPTYDHVPATIQRLRELPIGNFYAFHAERFRNTYHGLTRSFEEIHSGNAVLRERGMQRLSAKLAYGLGGQQLISESSKLMFGVTEEENTAIKNLMLPEWSRNSELAYYRDDDGNLLYMDLAYQHPDSPIINVVNAALNEFLDPNTPQAEIEDRLAAGMWEAGKELASPFITEALFADALLQVLSGQGVDSDGRLISGWNADEDALSFNNIGAGVAHAFMSLIPGTLKQLDPTGTLSSNKLGSQVWESLTQENPVDRYGEKIDPSVELFTNMTGLRYYKITDTGIRRALEFKANNFSTTKRKKEKELNKIIQYGTSAEDILNKYLEVNREYFDDYVSMHLAVVAAQNLGVENYTIKKNFKSMSGMTPNERVLLITGANNFVPLTLNSNKMSEVLDSASFDTMSFDEFRIEYVKLRQHLLQLPLIDLVFKNDITPEQEKDLKLIDEDFPFFKTRLEKAIQEREKRQKYFTGALVSKDYPVTDASENPADRNLNNLNISFNEVASNKENSYPTYTDDMERLGFNNGGTPVQSFIEDTLKTNQEVLQPSLPTLDFLKVAPSIDWQEYLLRQKKRLKLDDMSDENFLNINNEIFDTIYFLESDRGQTNEQLGGTQLSPALKWEAENNLYQHNHISEGHLKYLRNKSSKDLDLEDEKLLLFTVLNFRPLHDLETKEHLPGAGDELYKKVLRNPTHDNILELYQAQWTRADPERYKEITGDDIEKNYDRVRQKFRRGGNNNNIADAFSFLESNRDAFSFLDSNREENIGMKGEHGVHYWNTRVENEDVLELIRAGLRFLEPNDNISQEDLYAAKRSLSTLHPDKKHKGGFPINVSKELLNVLKIKESTFYNKTGWKDRGGNFIPISNAAIMDYLYPEDYNRFNIAYQQSNKKILDMKAQMGAYSWHLQQEHNRQKEGWNQTKTADVLQDWIFQKPAQLIYNLATNPYKNWTNKDWTDTNIDWTNPDKVNQAKADKVNQADDQLKN